MTVTERLAAADEAAIRELIAHQLAAVCSCDLDRIMRPYAEDAIVFDVKPPWQARGRAEWRALWAACLPYFPDGLTPEVRDLAVAASGDLAFAHCLWRFTSPDKDNPATRTWIRLTGCYRKTNGQWQVVHEHVSVPFDPETGKAVLSLQV